MKLNLKIVFIIIHLNYRAIITMKKKQNKKEKMLNNNRKIKLKI